MHSLQHQSGYSPSPLITEAAIVKAPYRHLIVDDFLAPSEFKIVRKYVDRFANNREFIGQKEKEYGAHIVGINAKNLGPLSNIINIKILESISALFGIDVTASVDAAVHIHPPGSPSGWLHTDFNAGWFENENPGELSFSGRTPCDYRTGYRNNANIHSRELTRSIAMILYFNEDWNPDHGGETVLGRSAIDNIENAKSRIPPIANRFFAFECSPISFHSFVKTSVERKSVIFWAHSEPDFLSKRWPLSLRSGWK